VAKQQAGGIAPGVDLEDAKADAIIRALLDLVQPFLRQWRQQ